MAGCPIAWHRPGQWRSAASICKTMKRPSAVRYGSIKGFAAS